VSITATTAPALTDLLVSRADLADTVLAAMEEVAR
jgi:hypothetical protein